MAYLYNMNSWLFLEMSFFNSTAIIIVSKSDNNNDFSWFELGGVKVYYELNDVFLLKTGCF